VIAGYRRKSYQFVDAVADFVRHAGTAGTDAQRRPGKWWIAEEVASYHRPATKMVAQFDSYCRFRDLCVNGKQVLGENIADVARLLTPHAAYVLSLKGKIDLVIGGLTGERRFFLDVAKGGGRSRTKLPCGDRLGPTPMRQENTFQETTRS
jgi:hypothetical protein